MNIVKLVLLPALLVALLLKESIPAPLKEWAIEVYGGIDEAQSIADEFGLDLVGKVHSIFLQKCCIIIKLDWKST